MFAAPCSTREGRHLIGKWTDVSVDSNHSLLAPAVIVSCHHLANAKGCKALACRLGWRGRWRSQQRASRTPFPCCPAGYHGPDGCGTGTPGRCWRLIPGDCSYSLLDLAADHGSVVVIHSGVPPGPFRTGRYRSARPMPCKLPPALWRWITICDASPADLSGRLDGELASTEPDMQHLRLHGQGICHSQRGATA